MSENSETKKMEVKKEVLPKNAWEGKNEVYMISNAMFYGKDRKSKDFAQGNYYFVNDDVLESLRKSCISAKEAKAYFDKMAKRQGITSKAFS